MCNLKKKTLFWVWRNNLFFFFLIKNKYYAKSKKESLHILMLLSLLSWWEVIIYDLLMRYTHMLSSHDLLKYNLTNTFPNLWILKIWDIVPASALTLKLVNCRINVLRDWIECTWVICMRIFYYVLHFVGPNTWTSENVWRWQKHQKMVKI
jgi:hypothetical protein